MCASFTYSKKLLPVIAICLSLSTLISKCAQTFIRIMQFVRAQHLASKSSWVCTQWSKSTYLKNKNKKQKSPQPPKTKHRTLQNNHATEEELGIPWTVVLVGVPLMALKMCIELGITLAFSSTGVIWKWKTCIYQSVPKGREHL